MHNTISILDVTMGGKQLEVFKFLLYISLPVGAIFYVLRPSFIEEVQKRGVRHTSGKGERAT